MAITARKATHGCIHTACRTNTTTMLEQQQRAHIHCAPECVALEARRHDQHLAIVVEGQAVYCGGQVEDRLERLACR